MTLPKLLLKQLRDEYVQSRTASKENPPFRYYSKYLSHYPEFLFGKVSNISVKQSKARNSEGARIFLLQ